MGERGEEGGVEEGEEGEGGRVAEREREREGEGGAAGERRMEGELERGGVGVGELLWGEGGEGVFGEGEEEEISLFLPLLFLSRPSIVLFLSFDSFFSFFSFFSFLVG